MHKQLSFRPNKIFHFIPKELKIPPQCVILYACKIALSHAGGAATYRKGGLPCAGFRKPA